MIRHNGVKYLDEEERDLDATLNSIDISKPNAGVRQGFFI